MIALKELQKLFMVYYSGDNPPSLRFGEASKNFWPDFFNGAWVEFLEMGGMWGCLYAKACFRSEIFRPPPSRQDRGAALPSCITS
jgi:hypothetical protein